jgi:Dolichyl-phosphate-mannose-protein mannosyltransferase
MIETRRPPAPRAVWHHRRGLGAAALALAALALFVSVPAYSAFDSIYSLVWGQELLHGELPSFDAYRAPTQHPLWVALTTVLAALGEDGSRAVVGVCVAGFVALVIGGFRLASAIFGEVVGWVFALLLLSRLDYGFLAARGYIDVPFLALIVWAAALEAERPRRGTAVFALLCCAGLLRPEAWLLSGAYALYLVWTERRRPRWSELAWVLAAPLIWTGSDWLVTGDPLYSSNYTTRSALSLGRRVPLSQLPERLWHFMSALTKLPVLAAGVAGLVAAFVLVRPRSRIALPGFLFVFGIATFLALSIRGFAVIDRYLVISALALTLFAAFAIGGFSVLEDARRRRLWALGSAVVVVLGTLWTAAHFTASHIRWELRSRQLIHGDMLRLLRDPEVVAARRCGPVTVPNHKLVPDVRYLLDASESQVLPRTRMRDFGRATRGVAIFVVGRRMLEHPAYGPFDQLDDSPLIQVPGEHFRLAASGTYLAAYVSCA